MQIVIFPQEDGSAAIMVPAPEYADQIEVVADRDVPRGTVWRIIDDSELPPCADEPPARGGQQARASELARRYTRSTARASHSPFGP